MIARRSMFMVVSVSQLKRTWTSFKMNKSTFSVDVRLREIMQNSGLRWGKGTKRLNKKANIKVSLQVKMVKPQRKESMAKGRVVFVIEKLL